MSLTAILLISLGQPTQAPGPPVSFLELAPGVHHAELASIVVGHAYRLDLDRVDVTLVAPGAPRTVDALLKSDGVVINASFFDEYGTAMGVARAQGRSLAAALPRRGWGALIVEQSGARVTQAFDATTVAPTALVVQGIPRLVVDGQPLRLKPQVARRTAVCADGKRLTLVVATMPVEANAFAQALAAPEAMGGLGCRFALNLDGGPSTQLAARLGPHRVDVPGGWGVPIALVAIPRPMR